MTLRDLLDKADDMEQGVNYKAIQELHAAIRAHASDFIALYEAAKAILATTDDFEVVDEGGATYTVDYHATQEAAAAVERLRPLVEGESDATP